MQPVNTKCRCDTCQRLRERETDWWDDGLVGDVRTLVVKRLALLDLVMLGMTSTANFKALAGMTRLPKEFTTGRRVGYRPYGSSPMLNSPEDYEAIVNEQRLPPVHCLLLQRGNAAQLDAFQSELLRPTVLCQAPPPASQRFPYEMSPSGLRFSPLRQQQPYYMVRTVAMEHALLLVALLSGNFTAIHWLHHHHCDWPRGSMRLGTMTGNKALVQWMIRVGVPVTMNELQTLKNVFFFKDFAGIRWLDANAHPIRDVTSEVVAADRSALGPW